jgi:radical SAM protein with 4Fe4S-binding SPASM domain
MLVQEVDFTGGEPFLRSDLMIIAGRLQELGINTCILTHGYGYSEEDINRLQAAGISGAGISLDGLEETHDYIRRSRGSFASVMKTIRLMQDAKLAFNVITTVNAKNVSELPELFETLASEKVQNWRLQALIPMGRVKNAPELQMDEARFRELGLFIREHENKNDSDSLNIICSDGLQYITPTLKPWLGCGAGIVTCGITADGKIKGCLSMPDELIEGDLRRKSLWEIWFNSDAFAYNRSFTTESLGSNCESCEKAMECKGGCSSSSYAMSGSFHNDPFCFHRINNQL